MTENRVTSIILMMLAAFAGFLCLMIIRPFMKPIVFALVLVILFYPLHSRILKLLPYPNIAALLSTFLVVLLLAAPVLGLGGTLGSEFKSVFGSLANSTTSQAGQSAVWPGYLQGVLRRVSDSLGLSGFRLETVLRDQLESVSGYFLGLVAGVFKNIALLLAQALASFIILFFLFRDGATVKKSVTSLLPSGEDQLERLFEHINGTLIATVYGSLVIASVQGLLTGVAFWALGLRSPILWGVVMGVFALVPVIGTGFVWIPAAGILALSGHVGKAVALVVWCSVVVHPIDNIARPYWISGRIKGLNTLYLFLALLGGLRTFGFLGLFIGPVVLSLTAALFKMLREEITEWPGISQPGGSGVLGNNSASPQKVPVQANLDRAVIQTEAEAFIRSRRTDDLTAGRLFARSDSR